MDLRNTETRDHTLYVVAENKDGVLARISGLLCARGFGVESICVGPGIDRTVVRMTLVVRGDESLIEQVIKQLQKLMEVIKVADLTGVDHVEREMLLVRVLAEREARGRVLAIADAFGARIVDTTATMVTLEATDESLRIDAVLQELRSFEIQEVVRTGKIAIARARATQASAVDAADPVRRKHRRHAVSFEVRLTSVDELVKLWTDDVSNGGMSVATERTIPIGAKVELRVIHPRTGEAFGVDAVVRRHIDQPNLRGVGVEFVNMDDARRARLRDFIHRELIAGSRGDLLDVEDPAKR